MKEIITIKSHKGVDFWRDYQFGDEQIDKYFLKFLDQNCKHFELKNDEETQFGKHCDVLCINKKGKKKLLEIKNTSYYNTHIFAETVSCPRDGTLGWMHTCEADYLLYGMPTQDRYSDDIYVYIIDFPRFKQWFWEMGNHKHCVERSTKKKNASICKMVSCRSLVLHEIAKVCRLSPYGTYEILDDGVV